jgi:hypothetical protein
MLIHKPMYMKKNLLLFLSCYILSIGLRAQSCANYSVTRTTGITYSSMGTAGTVIPYWLGQIANQNDDNRSAPIPLGFDFWYLGARYTTINICTNGYLDFSPTTYDGNYPLSDPNPAPSNYVNCAGFVSYRQDGSAFLRIPCGGAPPVSYGGTYFALAAMYCDLWVNNGTAAVANSIKYKTTGVAPNRVFTAEYFSMDDFTGGAPADYNFQVTLHETSGTIDFVYGTMTSGGATPSYACGINGQIVNPISGATLLSQQADNSGTFGSTVTPLHTNIPTSNSMISFASACSVSPGGPLTFTAVGNTTMTLNWIDASATELGYVIYMSTDGINYNFYTQTAANVTSYAASSLYGTTYYWKVYAVREGCLSTPISGSQATLAAGNFISVMTGNWSNGATWLAGTVPTAGDNVIIDNGHTVTMDGSFSCTNLTVGQGTSGTLLLGNSAANRTIAVLGDILVNSGATFTSNPAFAATHTLTASGNVSNNGTIDMRPVATSLTNFVFNKNGNQTISGAAVTNNFNTITINMGAVTTNTLEVTAANFSVPANFLIMQNGTFKFSVPTNAVTLNVFTSITTIPATCALWMNSPNSILYAHSTLNFQGALTCSSGTVNVGDNADEALMSNGALLTLSGGTINVSGRLDRPSFVAVTNVNISGGTLNLNTVGSTSTTNAPFMMDVTGSSFNMSGGTIVIKNEGGTGAQDLGYTNTGCLSNFSVTGGTLQLGNAATAVGQNMRILTNIPVGNLIVETTNSPTATLITNPLTVLQNVNIKANGTFVASNLNITVGGNWINDGTFTAGTNTVTFNGTGTLSGASIGTANSSFHNVLITGTLTGHANTMNVKGNWTNNGVFNHNNGTVTFWNNIAQSLSSASLVSQTFYNLIVNKSGNTLTVAAPTVTLNINNDFTNTAGGFAAPPTTNVDRNVLITAGTVTAGTNIFVKGDWTRNGGTFTPGLNRVTFNGAIAQQINGTVASQTFYNFDVVKTGGTLLNTGGSVTTITAQDYTETSDNFTAPTTLTVNGNYLLTLGTHTAGTTTNIKGNWTYNGGTFVPNLGTVLFNSATVLQTIGGTLPTTFDNLTFNNSFVTASPQITFGRNENVNLLYTLTLGKVDMGGFTFTLGTGPVAATVGTLSYGAANTKFMGNGTFTRWFKTGSTVANANVAGAFPMGDLTQQYYTTLFLTAPATAPTTGGTASVIYTDPYSVSPVAFLDGATPIQARNNEVWALSTANGLAGGTYNLRADRTFAGGAVAVVTDLRLTLFGGVVGTAGVNAGTVLIPQVNRTALTLANLTNNFYISSINAAASPLPIELLTFTAKICDKNVCLDWSTATETNNDFFTVERSLDGINFEQVGIVNGAGNSTVVLNYSLVDNAPLNGLSYYRLKQTDFNGAFTYSNIETVNFTANTDFSFSIYPNPTDGTIVNIALNADKGEEVLVVVYDATGKETYSKVIISGDNGDNIYALDPSGKLAAGIYMITATSQQSIYNKKLIVK